MTVFFIWSASLCVLVHWMKFFTLVSLVYGWPLCHPFKTKIIRCQNQSRLLSSIFILKLYWTLCRKNKLRKTGLDNTKGILPLVSSILWNGYLEFLDQHLHLTQKVTQMLTERNKTTSKNATRTLSHGSIQNNKLIRNRLISMKEQINHLHRVQQRLLLTGNWQGMYSLLGGLKPRYGLNTSFDK